MEHNVVSWDTIEPDFTKKVSYIQLKLWFHILAFRWDGFYHTLYIGLVLRLEILMNFLLKGIGINKIICKKSCGRHNKFSFARESTVF